MLIPVSIITHCEPPVSVRVRPKQYKHVQKKASFHRDLYIILTCCMKQIKDIRM